MGKYLASAASIARARGRSEEASAYYRDKLELEQTTLGPEHPNVGRTINNIRLSESSRGHYEQAVEEFQRSLAIRKRVRGPEHPDIASSYNMVANTTG